MLLEVKKFTEVYKFTICPPLRLTSTQNDKDIMKRYDFHDVVNFVLYNLIHIFWFWEEGGNLFRNLVCAPLNGDMFLFSNVFTRPFLVTFLFSVDIKRDVDLFGSSKGRRSAVGMQIEHPVNNNTSSVANNNNNNNNKVAAADVKTERLSPVAAGDSVSSRSGTPSSSYPGTPPGMAAIGDRVASPAPNPLNRNCSDLIRSLAAKYQNANPSE